jgi:hypothetical protein
MFIPKTSFFFLGSIYEPSTFCINGRKAYALCQINKNNGGVACY